MLASNRPLARWIPMSTLLLTRHAPKCKAGQKQRQRSNSFLTAGYQPTTRELVDYSKTRDEQPRILPILDARVILSPGQYCCKNSSRSGALAAQKLVQGRRKFQDVITNELLGDDDVNDDKEKDPVRKIYTLIGHGVPNSLFEHFISTGREWLNCQNSMMSSKKAKHFAKPVLPRTPPQKTNSAVHLSLRNIPNCTILDRERILKTNASGTTSLIQWPSEWDHDLELFMVAMNRIGSRLSSIVMKPDTHTPTELATGDAAAGSVIIPSDLDKWNVSIRKGEVLPFSMLPLSQQDNTLVLTVEWLRNSPDCWTIILRLQDDFIDSNAAAKGLIRDPISLVFEGVYVTP